MKTLEEKLNVAVNQLLALNLSESEMCMILANILIHFAKTNVAVLDKMFIDNFVLDEQAFEDFNLLFSKLNTDQDSKSYLIASLGHQLIAISHSLDLDKEKHYAATDK